MRIRSTNSVKGDTEHLVKARRTGVRGSLNLVRRFVPSVSEPEPKAKGELRRTDVC